MERSNKLPEGVGKKIAEALKQGNDKHEEVMNIDEKSPEAFYNNNEDNNLFDESEQNEFSFEEEPLPSFEEEIQEVKMDEVSFDEEPLEEGTQEEIIYEDESIEDIVSQEEKTHNKIDEDTIQYENYSTEEVPTIQYETPVKRIPPVEEQSDIILTENVQTLLKLINDLPQGVTRQTGAQIIKQTMEALGISMTRVLAEAQQAHDKISQTVKNKLNTIQEYKQDIKVLESNVQSFKKDANELDDIISLFILSNED